MNELIPILCLIIFIFFLDYRVERRIKFLENDIEELKEKINNEDKL